MTVDIEQDRALTAPRTDPEYEPSLRSRFSIRGKTQDFLSSRPDRSAFKGVPRYGRFA